MDTWWQKNRIFGNDTIINELKNVQSFIKSILQKYSNEEESINPELRCPETFAMVLIKISDMDRIEKELNKDNFQIFLSQLK